MKRRLDQLTLQQLIDLSCGDGSVLLDKGEKAGEAEMLKAAASIMAEYKSVASPSQAKMDMLEREQVSKLRMKEKCANICLLLCSQNRHDMAREVLAELDMPENLLREDDAVRVRSQAILDEARYELGRIAERENGHGGKRKGDLRKTWLSEVAFVMSQLKVSIDMNSLNAAVYANLVHQSVERVKAVAKMPPMARMFM